MERWRLRNTGVENGPKLDSPTLAYLVRSRLRNDSAENFIALTVFYTLMF
jgi:hypothetical protein